MLNKEKNKTIAQTHIRKVVQQLENQGFEHIRARIEGYDAPKGFQSQQKDLTLVPDITILDQGEKHYIEVAHKTSNRRLLATKWKLLAQLSKAREGMLKIFVPHGHMRFTRELISAHNIQAELVKI